LVVVDTTVWIDYLHGSENPHTLWLDQEIVLRPIGLTDLILCEILQGFRNPSEFARVRDNLLQFHVFESTSISWAIAAAENYNFLRECGYTFRRTIDCLIATFCLQAGHELLHRDRDFDTFEKKLDLRVVHP
jgi:predicted nucleic acid-binding protein